MVAWKVPKSKAGTVRNLGLRRTAAVGRVLRTVGMQIAPFRIVLDARFACLLVKRTVLGVWRCETRDGYTVRRSTTITEKTAAKLPGAATNFTGIGQQSTLLVASRSALQRAMKRCMRTITTKSY